MPYGDYTDSNISQEILLQFHAGSEPKQMSSSAAKWSDNWEFYRRWKIFIRKPGEKNVLFYINDVDTNWKHESAFKSLAFRDVVPCSLGTSSPTLQRCLLRADDHLMMEAASISETSVNFDQTTWRNNPEGSQLPGRTNSSIHGFKQSTKRNQLVMRNLR
jgi:hypothetical protein